VVRRADLKLDHLPVPWVGDPRTASVLLLALNPGWRPETDALEHGLYAEENRLCLTFRSRVPFFSLDPRLAETPGHRWWSRRLRLLSERVGLERVLSGVACVEWFPYHSPSFRRLASLLPSQEYGFQLVERAIERGAVVVIMRSRAYWFRSVPALATADVLELRAPRSAYITPANLTPSGFERVCAALLHRRDDHHPDMRGAPIPGRG
jgi:hypothetical protein